MWVLLVIPAPSLRKGEKEWDVWRLAVLKSRSDSQNGPPLFKWKCALTRTTSDNRAVVFFALNVSNVCMHLRLSSKILVIPDTTLYLVSFRYTKIHCVVLDYMCGIELVPSRKNRVYQGMFYVAPLYICYSRNSSARDYVVIFIVQQGLQPFRSFIINLYKTISWNMTGEYLE